MVWLYLSLFLRLACCRSRGGCDASVGAHINSLYKCEPEPVSFVLFDSTRCHWALPTTGALIGSAGARPQKEDLLRTLVCLDILCLWTMKNNPQG